MKLLELVDIDRPRTVKHSLDPHTFPERMAGGREKSEELGHGTAAVAFKGKGPNVVNKTSYHASPDDGYIQYIKTVMKHQDNPFFPKIYNAKLYKEGDTYALNMQLERLYSVKNPKINDAVRHMFKEVGLDYDTYDTENWDDVKWVRQIQVKNVHRNPKFARAVNILIPHLRRFGSDLHRENLMVRLTGAGPQLVITDPVEPSTQPYAGAVRGSVRQTPVTIGSMDYDDEDVTPQTR